MIESRPNVAINSLKTCAQPARMCLRGLKHRFAERQVGCSDSSKSPENLASYVSQHFASAEPSFPCNRQRNHGIEVSAGYGAERKNDGHQCCASRKRISQEGDRDISTAQPITHDSRADNTG